MNKNDINRLMKQLTPQERAELSWTDRQDQGSEERPFLTLPCNHRQAECATCPHDPCDIKIFRSRTEIVTRSIESEAG